MSDKLTQQLLDLVKNTPCSPDILEKYQQRILAGNLTTDENPINHFCLYFGAFDPKAKQVFLGHHIKSGLWLFNGGHIDQGEDIYQTLKREIEEEWGVKIEFKNLKPEMLSLTLCKKNPYRPCKWHYDIWFFIPIDKTKFKPDKTKQAKEFFETRWLKINKAQKLVVDKNNLEALSWLEAKFESN